MFDFDLLADLPAPRDDEPPSLRDDIHDELADHLACAYRREVLKDGDEVAAEDRVIDRFGDPKRLARRLWWQAMWSRIMGQRILSGLQWMLTLAAVVLAGLVFRQQSELITEIRTAREADAKNYQMISDVMQRLQLQSTAPNVPSYYPEQVTDMSVTEGRGEPRSTPQAGEPPRPYVTQPTDQQPQSLTVKLVQETADGPPVATAQIALKGRHTVVAEQIWEPVQGMPIEEGQVIGHTIGPATGKYLLQVAEPDRYQLVIHLADGQFCEQSVLIRPREKRELTVICPKPREQAMVYVTVPPLSKELQSLKCGLEVTLYDGVTTVDGIKWQTNNANLQRVKFDPQDGSVIEITNQSHDRITDLRRSKPEERAIVLLLGPVQYTYRLAPRVDYATNAAVWPADSSPLTHNISPGENQWELELPEELLAAAKRLFVEPESATAPASLYAPGDAPQATTVGKDKPATLTIKLVQETNDGPPVTGASVTLELLKTKIESHVIAEKAPEGDRLFRHSGKYGFKDLLPHRDYELKVSVPNGQHCQQKIHIEPNEERELTVICPKPREKTAVYLKAPSLPEDLRRAGAVFGAALMTGPIVLDERHWYPSAWPMVAGIFDPETGWLNGIEERAVKSGRDGEPQKKDLTQVSDLERHIRLFTGPVVGNYVIGFPSSNPEIPGIKWPNNSMDRTELFTVDAGVNHHEIKIPEELITAARKQKATSELETPGDSPGAKTADDAAPAVLTVKLVQETADGPPVENAVVLLSRGRNNISFDRQDSQGRYGFSDLKPERYELRIDLPDGQTGRQELLIRDDEPRELTVICPRARKNIPVLITAPPLPDDLRQAGCKLEVDYHFQGFPSGDMAWFNNQWTEVSTTLDPTTGQIAILTQEDVNSGDNPKRNTDLSHAKDEDRIVFLRPGTYKLSYILSSPEDQVVIWPRHDAIPAPKPILRTLKPGDDRWELELPEELLAAARKKLIAAIAPGESPGADRPATRETADASPAAKTETALSKFSVVLNQDSPALWEVFRSTNSLDSCTLTLTDHATKRAVQPSASFLKSDNQNRTSARFEFNGLEAGDHVLTVRLPHGQIHSQNVTISDSAPTSIELDVPRERVRLPVLLNIPELPDDLKQANCRLSVQLTELPLVKDDVQWQLEEHLFYRMGFNIDGTAAYLTRPKQGTLHYGQSPQADNPAVLALGPVRCRFRLHVTNTDVGNGMIEQPLEDAEVRIVEAKTKDNGVELEPIAWNLELPEKFLAAARKQLNTVKGEAKPAADESAKSKVGETGE